ncbi:hypothetical protein SAMN05660461_5978 [Chitinophaga ginsengisegetis]|uniref:NrS-1 polymerase-like helicase domain-containing protein n=1 Tax=Chitinophaga ginsengisegetis TaxID=393003 RepID=A0A1T5PCG5_9BACT|nr:primase-helicase family protein [Chitinophaga ginsengisegetis]SKD10078.1 hypothetical protein SAMN05660461_5978 [Chitinophaga ginsengisegetis]
MSEELSYYQARMEQLGVTEELNTIELWQNVNNENVLEPFPIFRETERGIEILVYGIDRMKIPYAKEGSRWKKNDFCIVRLKEPVVKSNGDVMKYQIPKGVGTYPFFPPSLVKKFDDKSQIDTLFLTEGYFKAFKGAMHGLDIVGLSSITHLKEKDKNALHSDIIHLIRTCNVKKVVWLTDGDCLDITKKELDDGVDLYRRPSGFFKSAVAFKSLMEDKQLHNDDLEKFFVHIDSENVPGHPKGLDDLLIEHVDKAPEIVKELLNITREGGSYFWKCNITFGLSRLQKHFMLTNVNEFYEYHAQRRKEMQNISFVFNGTKYRYDDSKGECKIEVPRESKNYFRVGDHYFEFVKIPNKYEQLEQTFHRRLKTTIIDDHGKNFINHIPKYKAFCNVPDHVNYQQVIYGNFNTYSPFEHEPEPVECAEEDFPTIFKFLKHIFGVRPVTIKTADGQKVEMPYLQLAYDYIQLLYQRPTHILPIMCLVSKENETGKSTFAKFLKQIFTANVAIVGNQDLAADFNSHWASKLLVICDETKIDKQSVVEKVKSLSTADKIMMNAKGRDQVEMDCFLKFIFITNNEDNFIYASDEDLRYWIIKVPKLLEKVPGMEDAFKDEIPAFISFLNRRQLVTTRESRMWFNPEILKTEALKKVVSYSRPTIEKEIHLKLHDLFIEFGVQEIRMSRKNIQEEFFNGRYEATYLERVLKDNIKPEQVTVVQRYRFPRWETRQTSAGTKERVKIEVADVGRPYIFKREDYLQEEELGSGDPKVAYESQFFENEPAPSVAEVTTELPSDLPF